MRNSYKEIRAAVDYALAQGWRLEKSGPRAHAWGVLYCPAGTRGACRVSINGTPRVPKHEAQKIRRRVHLCEHTP